MSNKTYRIFTEKLGGTDPDVFVGSEGELFYDPATGILKKSDGITSGGVAVSGGGGAVDSVNSKVGTVVLNKGDIGLSNVDNTSDINKPISSAVSTALSLKADSSSLAVIATSGLYSDLSGAPVLASVAISGAYSDLSGLPTLGTASTHPFSDFATASQGATADTALQPGDVALVATSGAYNDLTGKPSLATVATSGAYADLTGKPSLATVATSGSYTDLINRPGVISKEFHVTVDGNDTGATGALDKPFKTIQGCLNYIGTLGLSAGTEVIVFVHAGTYAEDVTINRSRTHIVGAVKHPNGNTTNISGNIIVNPLGVTPGNVFNENVTLKNLLVGNSNLSAAAIVSFEGTSHCSLFLHDTRLICNVDKPALKITNDPPTPSNESIVRLYACELTNNGASPTIDAQTSSLRTSVIEAVSNNGSGPALKVNNDADVTFSLGDLETAGSTCIQLLGTATVTLNQSYIGAAAANADGVNIAAGCTFTSLSNNYSVPAGTGFAVKGVAGAVFVHANSAFFYNNKVSSAMGAGVVAITTSITLA